MAASEKREIDWRSAEVHDGTLTVKVSGASAKAWNARFASVLHMLDGPHTGWGSVALGKKSIEVTGIEEGTETAVRHFLESVVLEVNSALQTDVGQPGDAANGAAEPAMDCDARMSENFRRFANEPSSEEPGRASLNARHGGE